MKTTRAKSGLVVAVGLAAALAACRAAADDSTNAPRPEKCYTGTITSIDRQGEILRVKSWTTFNKSFHLGNRCALDQLDKNNATVNDLRVGEKVTVIYQSANGVSIADRVDQQPVRFTGLVKAIDYDKHTLVVHQPTLDKELDLPAHYQIALRDGRFGTRDNIKLGEHVTVTYETPEGMPTVREIAQTSREFTGTLTAIDLNDKTLRAETTLHSKKFVLADNCIIVLNGKPDGKLAELRPNDKLVFSYDEINGVNIVNRITPAEVRSASVATTYGSSMVPPVAPY